MRNLHNLSDWFYFIDIYLKGRDCTFGIKVLNILHQKLPLIFLSTVMF